MKSQLKLIFVIGLMLATLLTFGCTNNQTTQREETIKIGAILPLSGNAGVLGDYTLKGMQLAVDEQNAKGGLLGKKIELEVQDSKGDAKEGVSIIKNMLSKQDKPVIVYSVVSGVTLALKPETEANKVILMSAVGSDKFLENSKYTVRNFVAASTLGQEITSYVKDKMDIKNLTVFYSNSEFGSSVKDAVVKYSAEKGINIALTEPYDENSPDYKSLIAAKLDKNTECVYVIGVGKGFGTMLKQIRESGYTGKIISDPLVTFPDVMNTAGDSIKGIPYLDFAFDTNSQEQNTKTFVDAFKQKFNKEPQNLSVITYDGAKMLFDAISKVGSIDNDKIIAELNSMKDYKGVFGNNIVEDRNIKFTFAFKTVK